MNDGSHLELPIDVAQFVDGIASHRSIRGSQKPKLAFSRCHKVSKLVKELAERKGLRAHLVRFENEDRWLRVSSCSAERGLNPHSRWVHHVTSVEGVYVDFTARQFDPDAAFPVVTASVEEMAEHWENVIEPYEEALPPGPG